MEKADGFSCSYCSKQFTSLSAFLTHSSRTHKLSSERVYCEVNGIAITPSCQCGCGMKLSFQTYNLGYGRFRKGHNCIDGSTFTKEARMKGHQKYRENLISGKTIRAKKVKPIQVALAHQCPMCQNSYGTIEGLAAHGVRTHKISSEHFYLRLNNLEGAPGCACGCGAQVTYLDLGRGYREYVSGHAARVNNNWGHNQIARKNSENKRREMWASGQLKAWNDGLTKETDQRVAAGSLTIQSNHEELEIRSNRMREGRINGTIPTLSKENHSQWKGGISPLNSYCRAAVKLYSQWKYPKLVSSGFRCELCQKPGPKLEVHHNEETMSVIIRRFAKEFCWENFYNSKIPENDSRLIALKSQISEAVADYHVKNNVLGIVLCEDCHKAQHDKHNF